MLLSETVGKDVKQRRDVIAKVDLILFGGWWEVMAVGHVVDVQKFFFF